MTGGGTAGHVNPLLALADEIKRHEANSNVYALGTEEGLEARLVPERGYELLTIAKLPFPRKPSAYALTFPLRFLAAVREIKQMLKKNKIDVVVGFGGYASAPAYLAAKSLGIPLVLHEANALPGIANKIGSKFASATAVAFANTPIRDAIHIGMPLRKEIISTSAQPDRAMARKYFGLDANTPVLLVTGGSLGARSINDTIVESKDLLIAAGVQILHIVGGNSNLKPIEEKNYSRIAYCDRMELAICAADFAVSRAGAATVAEFLTFGLPALYVPYAVGNGEQRFNIEEVLKVGAGLTVNDREFKRDFVGSTLVPAMSSSRNLAAMAKAARSLAKPKATEDLYQIVQGVLSKKISNARP